MNNLIDSRNKQILKYLEIRQSADLQRLSQKMDVSTKTILNNIKELNTIFQGVAIIEKIQDKYKLYVLDQEVFERVKESFYSTQEDMDSPIQRISFILNTLMNSKEPIVIDELAETMCLGRTTLISEINKLRNALEEYHISIEGKTNAGIVLHGEEFNLRFFILNNIFHVIYDEDVQTMQLQLIVHKVASRYHFDKMTTDNLYKTFVTSVKRMQSGYPLATLEDKYYELKDHACYKIAKELLEEANDVSRLSISDEEILFLSLPIIGMRTPMQKEEFEFVEITEEIAELVLKILDTIKMEMSFHISPTDLLDDFAYHIGFMLQRLKYGVTLKNVSLLEAKDKYPLAFKMGELAKKVVEEETKYTISEDELGFLSTYFGIFLEEQKLAGTPVCTVGIISGSNRITGKMIELQLRAILGKETSYEIVENSQIMKQKLDTYDFIVSILSDEYDTDTPIVYLSDIFDEVEVARKIEQFKLAEKLKVDTNSSVHSYLAILLEQENFFVLDTEKNDQDNLGMMVDALVEKGTLEEEVKEQLHAREKRGSMKFGNHILFPHIIHNKDKVLFSIGVNKNPMVGQSKLVLLLCLPNNHEISDDVLMGVYDNIITISNHERVLNELSLLRSGKEFLMYMIKNDEYFN